MARLRYNGLVAELGGSLTNSGTTITFTAALSYNGGTAVPTVAGSDYVPLSIMSSSGGLAEIVYLTAYTSGATTGTISRGQEGTTGTTHSVGRSVVHAPNVLDFDDLVPKALYDAQSILIATSDNVPVVHTVSASRFVGRKASGDVGSMTAAEAWAVLAAGAGHPEVLMIAVSDETTAITTGTAKVTFRMPFAMTLTAVRASLTTASSSGTPTVDINEGGSTILSTKLTIDASEKTSTTAASAAVISDSALADDAEITIDIDVAGTGATGLKVYLIGTRA